MIARMQLAVLDYNSDLNNTQATVKDGKRRSNFFSKWHQIGLWKKYSKQKIKNT